jgi:large subunit ribosomal protein L9
VEVILLEKIENLGNIGSRVKVKPGYGRNYLLPQGKATLATPENITRFESMRTELERKATDGLTAAQARSQQLVGVRLNLSAKAGSEGKLFGSIGTIDIAEACTRAGVPVDRSEVRLPDGPIRVLGEHHVELHLHSDVNVPLTVIVLPEE